MGLCGSSLSEEEKASRALSQQAEADHNAEKRKIKLLLLGTLLLVPRACLQLWSARTLNRGKNP
jgi:hypothetical protein